MGYVDNDVTEMLQGLALRNSLEMNQAAKAHGDTKDDVVAAEDTATQEVKKAKKKKKKSKKKPVAAAGEADDALESETSTLKDPDELGQNKNRAEQTDVVSK
ncbi:hypothetical protein AAVH_04587 [Aphelenchoides avenae]|nr:hypothetical protein AAVH_04587 [Aphelenchus avenae]